jgi:hypothetical protein
LAWDGGMGLLDKGPNAFAAQLMAIQKNQIE